MNSNYDEPNQAGEPDQAAEIEHLHERAELRRWMAERRAKAPVVLALLRQHLPVEHRAEVEDYLSCEFGGDCLRGLLQAGR